MAAAVHISVSGIMSRCVNMCEMPKTASQHEKDSEQKLALKNSFKLPEQS